MTPAMWSIIGFVVWLLASRIQQRRLERGFAASPEAAPDRDAGLAAIGTLTPWCRDQASQAALTVLASAVLFPTPEVPPSDVKS